MTRRRVRVAPAGGTGWPRPGGWTCPIGGALLRQLRWVAPAKPRSAANHSSTGIVPGSTGATCDRQALPRHLLALAHLELAAPLEDLAEVQPHPRVRVVHHLRSATAARAPIVMPSSSCSSRRSACSTDLAAPRACRRGIPSSRRRPCPRGREVSRKRPSASISTPHRRPLDRSTGARFGPFDVARTARLGSLDRPVRFGRTGRFWRRSLQPKCLPE